MIWKPNEFKLAINMAGAVSAGAYTAGVLDFLTETLEEWETRKGALRAYLANPAGPVPELVPLHDVCIEVFSGASAGGMCAAIASVMVQRNFAHIHDTAPAPPTSNTFYEAWVNEIDIRKLLATQDVDRGQPLVSLLDSSIIDTIAAAALTPGPAQPKPWISENLTLLLSLTNVRGTPYQLYEDPTPAVEEFIAYYGDQIQFETTSPGAVPVSPVAKALPVGQPGAGAWPLLREAAMATGAFPLFLAPRVLTRDTSDYNSPPWTTPCDRPSTQVMPSFPPPVPPTVDTLNVDSGITDNNPFELAHDYLASQNLQAVPDPKSNQLQNPRPPALVDSSIEVFAPTISSLAVGTASNFSKLSSPSRRPIRSSALVLPTLGRARRQSPVRFRYPRLRLRHNPWDGPGCPSYPASAPPRLKSARPRELSSRATISTRSWI
jgi:hypothetical protein